MVSLKLIGEEILLGCPNYAKEAAVPVYIAGELTRRRLAFRSAPILYVSPYNPGAMAAAALLQAGMPGLRVVQTAPASFEQEGSKQASPREGASDEATHMLLYLAHATYLGAMGEVLAEELRAARAAGFPIVMLHENGKNGCEFGRFFETCSAASKPFLLLLPSAHNSCGSRILAGLHRT